MYSNDHLQACGVFIVFIVYLCVSWNGLFDVNAIVWFIKCQTQFFFCSSARCFDMTWQLLSFDCSQFSQSNLTDKVACALYYVMYVRCIDTFIVSFAFLARDFIVMPNVIKYIRSLRLLSVPLKCIRNTFIWSYMTFHTTTHWILETFTIPMLFKLSSVSS